MSSRSAARRALSLSPSPAWISGRPRALSYAWLLAPLLEGRYYLFLTRTAEGTAGYFATLVFVSDQPERWDWHPITELRAHAAEVLNVDGKWFVSSGGWTALTGEEARGLSLAPFAWLPGSPAQL